MSPEPDFGEQVRELRAAAGYVPKDDKEPSPKDVYDVTCPSCGAVPGGPCSGRGFPLAIHSARFREAGIQPEPFVPEPEETPEDSERPPARVRVPDDSEVRERWMHSRRGYTYAEDLAEFEAWMAEHDRKVKETSWAEGWNGARIHRMSRAENPYRKGQS